MSEQMIQVQLKDIIKSDEAIEALHLNPWCVNEGADKESWYTVKADDAKKWGLV